MSEENTQGGAKVEWPQTERLVKRLPADMNGATIDTIIEMVARNTNQSVTWRIMDCVPTVFTTGDVYTVLRELQFCTRRVNRRT